MMGFLGVGVYRPLSRQGGGGIYFFEITPATYLKTAFWAKCGFCIII
jgi:hypothetical protein